MVENVSYKKRVFFWKNWAKIPLKICGKVYGIFEHIPERFSRFWKITTPVNFRRLGKI